MQRSVMRARETCIHAVGRGTGTTFDDLPEGFLTALFADVAAWRAARPGPGDPPHHSPDPPRVRGRPASDAARPPRRHGGGVADRAPPAADLPVLRGWL
ncbi:hypothetical protein LWC35_31700 [Pseudonocardia kujensis]|uniref:hypothetical protein n=1 Tax=Pseudonocardia kujensis TaxID=1128675 RepID=UPI001E5C54F6|nr:hypothetical protein [Pseudonocardia kujensis]MCE0767429.1 hypothetical protein [Pseudonocardia kujensis]